MESLILCHDPEVSRARARRKIAVPRFVISGMLVAMMVVGAEGCAVPSTARGRPVEVGGRAGLHVWRPPNLSDDKKYQTGDQILSGFDALADGGELEVGDQVLLSIEVDRGREHVLWYVELEFWGEEVNGPIGREVRGHREIAEGENSAEQREVFEYSTKRTEDGSEVRVELAIVRVRLSLFDESVELLGRSLVPIPREVFGLGPFDSCEFVHELEFVRSGSGAGYFGSKMESLGDADRARLQLSFGSGIITILSLAGTIQQSEALAGLRSSPWIDIARWPSLWSMISHVGMRLTIEPNFFLAWPALYDWPGNDEAIGAFEFPMAIKVNGEEALRCRMVVTRPTGPLRLFAGIVYFEAVHPDNPDNRVRVQILAARRGSRGL